MEKLQQLQDNEETREPGREIRNRTIIRCPRCAIEIDGASVTLEWDMICPRCAHKVDSKKASSTELSTETHFDVAGEKEFNDLVKMIHNWRDAYIRSIYKDGIDWSAPHELFEEFGMQMVPYVARLREAGYSTPKRMQMIGTEIALAVQDVIEACDQQEELMRLTGEWTDKEQEIKDYWQEKHKLIGGNVNASLRIQM